MKPGRPMTGLINFSDAHHKTSMKYTRDNLKHLSGSEANKRLEAIIETAIDGIITIDETGIIESVNPAAAKIFGYKVKELIGKNIRTLMPSPYRENHDQYIRNYQETGVAKIIGIGREVTGLRKNKTTIPIRLAISEVKLDNRTLFTGIIHDMSDIKQAEESLIRLNEALESKVEQRTQQLEEAINQLLNINNQLSEEIQERKKIETALMDREEELQHALASEKELSELKSRFVSMASHEFRTPLSTILSSAALLNRYRLTSQQSSRDKHIRRIRSAVSNLSGILNDFLSLGKLEEGIIDIVPEKTTFSELGGEVVDEIEGLLKEGQVIYLIDETARRTFITDKRIMKNVLFNLLSNASKYSKPKAPIHCIGTLEGPELMIKIKDKGMGIPEEEQKHLFTRFFRASNATNIEGTGLGLTIVKEYMHLLGGSVRFQSEEFGGSEFVLKLPIT